MARAVVPLNFNAFLEKAKLKDDGSNYMDSVRNLRIILIAAQKNYVLEAPLGARTADTSILHHAFISIFIALWVVITHYVTILMPILSYFTRFTQGGRMPAAGILGWKRSKY